MAPQTVTKAFKFALDPTPRQARMFASHAGGARFAYNWGNACILAALAARQAEKDAGGEAVTKVPNHFDLCKQWTAWKNAHVSDPPPAEGERPTNTAWVSENFVGTYQAALRDAAKAWTDFFKSAKGERAGRRLGRPQFKKRGRCRDSFQVHGETLKIVTASGAGLRARAAHMDRGATKDAVLLPKIGMVLLRESGRKLRRHIAKDDQPCPSCRATGLVPAPAGTTAKTARHCTACHSTGGTCAICKGSGRLKQCGDCTGSRRMPACRIVRGTISRDSAGRWHISLTVTMCLDIRTRPSARQRAGGVVGVDMGVRDTVTLSTGERFPNPAHLESALRKLAAAQRAVSRRTRHGQTSSKRRDKAVHRVGRIHNRVANLRRDHLENLSSRLVHTHELIGVEGFDLRQIAELGSKDLPRRLQRDRNRHLAGAALGMFRWQLDHKATWYGCQVKITSAHAPTGRTCSVCGTARTTPLPPHHEQFSSDRCGHVLDRRLNSALVLAGFARDGKADAGSSPESLNARGAGVRPPGAREGAGRLPASKREASTRPHRGEAGTPSG